MFRTDSMKMVFEMQKSSCSDPIPIQRTPKGLEVKSGSLQMVQCCGGKLLRIPVLVRVYQNSFEHYAVIYKDQKYTNSAMYISLKHCKVYRSDSENEIKVVPDEIDGNNLTFQVSRKQDINDWITVLQSDVVPGSPPKGSMSPHIRRTPLMPTLQESLEEDSEEEEDS